jgi:hypothetical protein
MALIGDDMNGDAQESMLAKLQIRVQGLSSTAQVARVTSIPLPSNATKKKGGSSSSISKGGSSDLSDDEEDPPTGKSQPSSKSKHSTNSSTSSSSSDTIEEDAFVFSSSKKYRLVLQFIDDHSQAIPFDLNGSGFLSLHITFGTATPTPRKRAPPVDESLEVCSIDPLICMPTTSRTDSH